MAALALFPRLEKDASDGLVHVIAHAVDDEDVFLLGYGRKNLVEFAGRLLKVVEIGSLRRLDDVEENALIFFGWV